jgi:hypothetical protein
LEAFTRSYWRRQEVKMLSVELLREPYVLKRINPAGPLVAQYNTQLRGLEDRFGMSPRARRNLGVDIGRRKLSSL